MSISSEDTKPISAKTEDELPAIKRSLSWKVATNLFISFKYAGQGIAYAFRTQRNFRIHTIIGAIALSLSLGLHLSRVETAVIGLTCGMVLALELVNTALESVVDLTVQQSYHELAKIAKDCAAAAVLVTALIAVLVAACLLIPPLWSLYQTSIAVELPL